MRLVVAAGCLVVSLVVGGCTSGELTTPIVFLTYTTDTFSGTVPAAVNGLPQTDQKTFRISSSGTITVVLTSAVETFPSGSTDPGVVVGVSLGTFSGGACTPFSNTFLGKASLIPILSGSVPAAGFYCLQLTNQDVSAQSGPVAYTVLVTHPE